jgi:UDP-N-acetylmuramoyl-L-alanyl-D-glutamate--2,6-diaminopimelate ligase
MMLSAFEGQLRVLDRRGPPDADVRSTTADSREVAPATLFGAIPGTQMDGHGFIPQAVAGGVAVVVLRDWPASWPDHVVGLQVDDPRRSLALASAALCGHPSRRMATFGITGTNGKTSTVAILASILRAAGLPTATLGTTGFEWDEDGAVQWRASTHTTPEGPELFRWLSDFEGKGVEAVALELSSHALEQGRAAGLALDVAAWSNLSRDHLDFHGDMDAYEAAKSLLLTEWLAQWGKEDCAAVLNVDDPVVAKHVGVAGRTVRVSARGASADVRTDGPVSLDRDGVSARVLMGEDVLTLRSSLLGWHNVDNLLLAGACAWASNVPTDAIEAGWAAAVGAPGRLERVEGDGPLVLVDYAHTPDALERALSTVRRITEGRVHVVFGAGGDRDPGKRPLMAQAAIAGADAVILTTDNPRSESPESILNGIEAGLSGTDVPWLRIVDRAEAIAIAVGRATEHDTVLIAGKGHETYQEVDGVLHPFDDRVHARRALEARS